MRSGNDPRTSTKTVRSKADGAKKTKKAIEDAPPLPDQSKDSAYTAAIANLAVMSAEQKIKNHSGKSGRKAHRGITAARTFENDLSSMEEMGHLNEQREKIAGLLKGLEKKVAEEKKDD